MSEQITREQAATAGYDRLLERMSMPAKLVLIKIGTEWVEVVGSSGSWVSKEMLGKALEQEAPWTANKITNKGRGRNGVVYSLIPLLKAFELVTIINGTHTRYMLNQTGKEVLNAMIFNCGRCRTTRLCSCGDGFSHHYTDNHVEQCGHIDREDCEYCNGTGNSLSGDYDCRRCTLSCQYCDGSRNRYCYECRGTKVCGQCKGVNLDE